MSVGELVDSFACMAATRALLRSFLSTFCPKLSEERLDMVTEFIYRAAGGKRSSNMAGESRKQVGVRLGADEEKMREKKNSKAIVEEARSRFPGMEQH